jgi:type I restriction enzyme S subunit
MIDGWTESTLGQACDLRIGGTPSRNVEKYWDNGKEGTNLWVSIRDLTSKYIEDTAEYITDVGVKNSNVKLLAKGTILLSFKLTIGKVAIAGKDLYSNEAIVGLTPHEGLDTGFLYFGLQHWDLLSGVDQAIKGATLNKEKLQKIKILYPEDIAEQQTIAQALNRLDLAIEDIAEVIAKQQRIKTGLMQDLLTKGIDENGQVRSEKTHAFKDTALGRFPVDWDVSPASALCDAVIDCKNRTPPVHKDGHPVIRTPNVRSGSFVYEDLVHTDSVSHKIWTARGKPSPGDIVITREAPFGEACRIPVDVTEPCLGQRIMLYKPNKDLLDADFLVSMIYSERLQRRLFELAGGSTVGHIRVGDIRSLLIPHPKDISEQRKIAEPLVAIEECLQNDRNMLRKLLAMKQGLLHDLLTGKVRVTLAAKEEKRAVGAVA